MELYLFVLLALVLGVLSGVVGGAVGSYLADGSATEQGAGASA